MEDAKQQGIDAISSHGDRAIELHNVTKQPLPLPPKDERIISGNPPPHVVNSGAPKNIKGQLAATQVGGALWPTHPFNSYASQEQGYYTGGYHNGAGNWDEHSNYVNANNLHVAPTGIYNDNSSIYYSPGYGSDVLSQISPLASPIMIDGQLFSPQQMPINPPSYYPPRLSPAPQHFSSGISSWQAELVSGGNIGQENHIDTALLGTGSGYYLPFGSFGGDLSGNGGFGLYKFPGELGSNESMPSNSSSMDFGGFMSSLNSGNTYPQPIGVLGSYEQNFGQMQFQSFGLSSNPSNRHFGHAGSYQSIGSTSIRYQSAADSKGGTHERDHESLSISTDTLGSSSDNNRGPRAAKIKSKSPGEEGSSGDGKDDESTEVRADHINSPDFITYYEQAMFFVIKSLNEDNVHKSIKYGVWSSTPLGNKKLDAAYGEAKEIEGSCPVYLFFSVNASGQFCGVAEMIGPVDFDHDADHWLQDRWTGQFPVKWHIIKDVPNSCFRHIVLENNDKKSVTHSRDSQEVKLKQGIEMLEIFKNHDSDTTLLDDFEFYDGREKSLKERKAKERASSLVNTSESVNKLSDNLAEALHMDRGGTYVVPKASTD